MYFISFKWIDWRNKEAMDEDWFDDFLIRDGFVELTFKDKSGRLSIPANKILWLKILEKK